MNNHLRPRRPTKMDGEVANIERDIYRSVRRATRNGGVYVRSRLLLFMVHAVLDAMCRRADPEILAFLYARRWMLRSRAYIGTSLSKRHTVASLLGSRSPRYVKETRKPWLPRMSAGERKVLYDLRDRAINEGDDKTRDVVLKIIRGCV